MLLRKTYFLEELLKSSENKNIYKLLNPTYNMINTEYLAISAIFTVGFFIGFKLREATYSFRDYLTKNKKFDEKNKYF